MTTQATERVLRRRRSVRLLVSVSKLLFGLPLSFVAALVLGSMFWMAAFFLGWQYPWSWFFLTTAAVTIPLLYHLELRTDGQFVSEAVRDSTGSIAYTGLLATLSVVLRQPLGAVTALAGEQASPRAATAGFVELFLTGPRLVIEARRHLRLERLLRNVSLSHAAEIVVVLASSEKGIARDELQRRVGSSGDLLPALAFLASQEWIGVGEKVDRVWLRTEAREVLRQNSTP